MIHDAAMVGLLALTHVCCLAVMTERKYSPGKTVAAYAAFAAYCIGWTLIVSAWIGAESPYAAPAMFSATIVAGFFIFVLTPSDALCKKLFLFISYSNLFCILHCTAVLIADALVPSLSDIEMQYARNITRTLLYIPVVLTYLTFFRPRIRTVPVKKRRTWYSISLVSLLFLAAFASFVVLFYPHGGHKDENIFLFAVVVLIYGSVLWVIFETVQYMSDESSMELIGKISNTCKGSLHSPERGK